MNADTYPWTEPGRDRAVVDLFLAAAEFPLRNGLRPAIELNTCELTSSQLLAAIAWLKAMRFARPSQLFPKKDIGP